TLLTRTMPWLSHDPKPSVPPSEESRAVAAGAMATLFRLTRAWQTGSTKVIEGGVPPQMVPELPPEQAVSSEVLTTILPVVPAGMVTFAAKPGTWAQMVLGFAVADWFAARVVPAWTS